MTGPAPGPATGPTPQGGAADDGDSAGQPWTGRSLPDTGFESDTGAADPVLAQRIRELLDDVSAATAFMAALSTARLLVPVVAEPGEVDRSGEHAVEKQTDMASITLTAPDGTRALPVFTSAEALAKWDATARPVPVTAGRAAQAAVLERCDVLVLDLGGPRELTLRPSMLWALAQERPWLPPHEDPDVVRAVADAVAREPQVRTHAVGEGTPPGHGVLAVELELSPGLERDEVQLVATRLGERLATDGELRARIDGLAFTIR